MNPLYMFCLYDGGYQGSEKVFTASLFMITHFKLLQCLLPVRLILLRVYSGSEFAISECIALDSI